MVITNTIICDANGEREEDIRIEDGLITEIGKGLTCSEILDAKGAYFIPSLVVWLKIPPFLLISGASLIFIL